MLERVQRHRRLAIALCAIVLLLLAHPVAFAASDLFQNVGPEPQVVGGLADEWPLGRYALDTHVKGISVGLGGVDTGDVPAQIAGFLANAIWQFAAWLANAVISWFTFAFSLDLVNGSSATGGAGALQPVSDAVRNIYNHSFGEEWMVVAILLASFWAMWRALVQRRFSEVAGALALSLAFAVIALTFVARPDLTIGEASKWTNRVSASFLSISRTGEPTSEAAAKRDASDQLFKLLVFDPWVVLNFGGLEHCVKTPVEADDPESVAVRPLARNDRRDAALRRQLAASEEVAADGKVCINNGRKYAAHFLRWAPGDLKRSGGDAGAYKALADGEKDLLADRDPGRSRADLGPADKPAVDAMQAGGQFTRLVIAIVIFFGELGILVLLGMLATGVILAQIVVLLLLLGAPIMLVLGILPGRGHQAFLAWLSKIAGFLLRKAVYSLVLSALLALASAMTLASANLGWFMAFGIQAAFFWTVWMYRKEIVGQVNHVIAGVGGQGGDGLRRLQSTYYSARMLRAPTKAVVGAPVAATAAVLAPLALLARRRSTQQRQDRGAAERQDLADRITEGLRAPRDGGSDPDGPAGGSPVAPDPPGGAGPSPNGDVPPGPDVGATTLPLLRRYPTRSRPGSDDTTTGSNGHRPGASPGDGHAPAAGAAGSTPSGASAPSVSSPAPNGRAGESAPPRDTPGGRAPGAPADRDKPAAPLRESLQEDRERVRESRERQRAGEEDRSPRQARDDVAWSPRHPGELPDGATMRKWEAEWDVIREEAAPLLDRLDREGREDRERAAGLPRHRRWRRPRPAPPDERRDS